MRHFALNRISAALIMALVALSWSCQKAPMQDPKPEKEALLFMEEPQGENPLDDLGRHHYYALEHLAEEGIIDEEQSVIYGKTRDCLKDSLEGDHFLSFGNAANQFEDYIADVAGTKQDFIELPTAYFKDYLQSNASLSGEVKAKLDDLRSHYDNYSGYQAVMDDLSAFEAAVMDDEGLSDGEEDLLWGMAAVARYDLAYWRAVRADEGHEWHEYFEEDLEDNEAEALMLNLSLSSAINFGVIYDQMRDDGYEEANRHSAALLQATYHGGPIIVDNISM